MPRRARLRLAGIAHHVLQRGNNRSPCFFVDQDYRFYLECLRQAAARYACAIHAYVLMPNHVHLLVSPSTEEGISLMMRHLGSRYVHYVNRGYQRSGTLWEGRFRSHLIDSERYLLTLHHYIESNPVRAKAVETPGDYRWSSYVHYAEGREDSLISNHHVYLALGNTDEERRRAYRAQSRIEIERSDTEEIRGAVRGGPPIVPS